jgi:hypothetical protein
LSTLQQVQQSSPTEYQQLTQLIATNLQQAAQQSGNSASASQLSNLATDFTNASSTGSLPNISDLANAIGGAADPYGGNSGQQLQESSFSLQISVSESSVNTGGQNTQPISNTPATASSIPSQPILQASAESSFSYQLNLSETSITTGGQNSATNQLSPLDAQQLIALITKSLQSAAQTAQSGGNSAEANLLNQLATDFANVLGNQNQANSGDSYSGAGTNSGSTTPVSASSTSQQQLQESLLAYQLTFSEGSTNGNTTSQEAYSLSGASLSLSAAQYA